MAIENRGEAPIPQTPIEQIDPLQEKAIQLMDGIEQGLNLQPQATETTVRHGDNVYLEFSRIPKGRSISIRQGSINGSLREIEGQAIFGWANHNGKGERGGPEVHNSPEDNLVEISKLTEIFFPITQDQPTEQ